MIFTILLLALSFLFAFLVGHWIGLALICAGVLLGLGINVDPSDDDGDAADVEVRVAS